MDVSANALRAVLVLSYASIVLSVGIFTLSMLSLGMVSLFTGPFLAISTFIYNITILANHHGWCGVRRRRGEGGYAGSTTSSIVLAFMLGQFWMLPEMLILIRVPLVFEKNVQSLGVITGLLFVFHTFEVAVMMAIAVLSLLLSYRSPLGGKCGALATSV